MACDYCNPRSCVLESCHGLAARRPQFERATLAVRNGRQIRRAPCGCVNFTALGSDGPSADGTTWLCSEHAICTCSEYDEYEDVDADDD